jgi:anti-anti-sigma factor
MSLSTSRFPFKVEQSHRLRIITFAASKFRDVEDMLGKALAGQTDGIEGYHLLLDFTNVESISSVELGTLLLLHKRMQASEGRLTLFNLSPQIYEVFTVTRLHTIFGICTGE